VPTPGGAVAGLDHSLVTTAKAAARTLEVHYAVFARRGLEKAFGRVIGLVVRPDVEFGDDYVVYYDRAKARDLTSYFDSQPGMLFGAHSTDYQTAEGLAALVEDGFATLKVGPC